MKPIDRRRFMQVTAAGFALGTVNLPFPARMLSRSLQAASQTASDKKMLVIFLRGGNDGVNTCIPYGDSEYNATNRPNILIPEADALDLGNGFAALHPSMSSLYELYQQNQVAIIHRTGYTDLNRSHFEGQQFWENGQPGSASQEGWLYRHVDECYDLGTNPLAAASVSSQLMLMLRGSSSLPHISSLEDYNLNVPGSSQDKFLGSLPGSNEIGSGLKGWSAKAEASTHGYFSLLGSTGIRVGETLDALSAAGIDPQNYQPNNGAVYPSGDNPAGFPPASYEFFQKLRDAAILLRETDLRVAAIELQGFDTHINQGAQGGAQAGLLSYLSFGIRQVSLDLQSMWNDLAVVTLSEFGRTSEQNGSNGTDHGEASCMFVAGGGVNGGVYNCDATTGADGDLFSTPNGRYVSHRTDFRSVLGEVLTDHFGLGAGQLETVFPGYGSLSATPVFQPLSFMV